MQKIGLIDYGTTGNISSIYKALEAAGANILVVKEASDFNKVDKLVLPGVGGFHDVMSAINASGFKDSIYSAAQKKPILGICLGMQMLADVGYEFGETEGFGLISGEVKKMQSKGPVPHIGFNTVNIVSETPLFKGISPDDEFYFMHSYEFVNYTDVVTLTTHYGHQFVSAINKENIFGVQFHPEKSRGQGIRLLKNFIEL